MTVSAAITPEAAARAYSATQLGAAGGGTETVPNSFEGMLGRALEGAVQAGHAADAEALAAIGGGGNLTEVVTAVSKAELALQTAAAIRDRVVQAYQDIMHMPI
jgi:flagellar hook-basal body complex protein FliE